MSTPTTPLSPTQSCWESFTTTAGNTCNWLGRQVTVVCSTLKSWASQAWAALSAFFTRACNGAAHYGAMGVNYIKANTKQVGIVFGGVAAAVGLYYLFQSSGQAKA